MVSFTSSLVITKNSIGSCAKSVSHFSIVPFETSELLVFTYKHFTFAFVFLAISKTIFNAFLSFGLKRVVNPIVPIFLNLASNGTHNIGTLIWLITEPVLVPTKKASHPVAPEVPITTKSILSSFIAFLILESKSPSISLWVIFILSS
ncbi:hypothetical protein D3C85_1456870 [compost metagenome]